EDIHFNARPAGTYYARVFRFSGDTNYNLRLSTADPSNILAPQENLGNIGNTAVVRTGSINPNNSSDFYRFSVASLANVNAQLTGLSADADLRIIQDVNNSGTVDAGDVTVASTSGGSAAENLNLTALAGGNYFAQVYQFGSNTTNYSLRLITEDNSLASANNIGTLTTTPVSFSNFVGATDTQDYWRFTLSGTSDINIGLTGLTADADVQLLNSAGTVIASS
ncbi:PPC domain-containing protein, partial [Microcystis aeruginosa]